jgi:putative flavoprotein involved in K+ transport
MTSDFEHVETLVIGAGQAGLAVGHHLAARDLPFLIVDAGERIGDAWRNRWDSLRLFTPARYDGLDGMPFPARPDYFPTKDEMADYLESYADAFDLSVRLGYAVDRLSKHGDKYLVTSGDAVIEADNVVVAMGSYQQPRVPPVSQELAGDISQLHSADYRRPEQLQAGDALVVGAANSGAEIAIDIASDRRVWLSGRHPGHVPFDIDSWLGRHWLVRLVVGGAEHRLFKVSNPIGRKVRRKMLDKGVPLIRRKPKDLDAAGVAAVPRLAGVRDGRPVLEDGRTLDVANVIWCTGFTTGFTWIDIDLFDDRYPDRPRQHRGIVPDHPGLYFVGLIFQYAVTSGSVCGVGRDAAHVADAIAARLDSARKRRVRAAPRGWSRSPTGVQDG